MKKHIVILMITVLLYSCKTQTHYVPVESVKTEYKDRLLQDSIYLHDSIVYKMAGDTVFMEKYKLQYRYKLVRDSMYLRDSIAVPYPVVEYIETNKISGWQNFQIWCGRILIIMVIGYLGFKYIRRFI